MYVCMYEMQAPYKEDILRCAVKHLFVLFKAARM